MGGAAKTVKNISSGVKAVAKNPTNVSNLKGLAQTGAVAQYDPMNMTGMQTQAPEADGFSMGGRPSYPGFQSFLDKNYSGNLTLPGDLQARQVLGQQGADQLKAQALSTDSSPWAKTLMDKQALATQGQIGNLAQQGNTNLAQANASMARGGGLRGGFSSAMQNQNLQNQMLQGQNIRSQGAQQNLDIQLQDQQQKQGLLQNLVGQDIGQRNIDIGNTIAEKRAQDLANTTKYGQQMQGWAANQQGNAIANSGKK